jgi:3-carboxy-cis,cis-muconate cycloisomerase
VERAGIGLFGSLYGTAEMRAIFSEERGLQAMLDVEVALARAEAALGVIPAAAAEAIAAVARADLLDRAAIVAGTENVGYPIVPLTKQLAALAGPDAGRYVHWGATTQDILDTALVLQLRDGLHALERDLAATARALAARATLHAADVMAGRTHLQHALPITFGYKCAIWLAPLLDGLVALRALGPRTGVVQFGGAVGTLASLGARGRDVAAALAAELGLDLPDAPWHADRARIAETACTLAIVCGSLAKFATDVILLMQTEVAEVFEPQAPGRGGSSTMPQKRNPVASEYVIAAARGVRALAPLSIEALAGDHERSTGPWQSEAIALPQMFVLASAAFAQARALAEGMTVDPRRMRNNLDLTHGLIVAEAVTMALAEKFGKRDAHHVVEAACARALETGADLADILAADERVAARFGPADLRRMLAPENYLGESRAVVERVVTRADRLLEIERLTRT